MKALNKSQVTALFEREAILMGTDDLVPEKKGYRPLWQKCGCARPKHGQKLSRPIC